MELEKITKGIGILTASFALITGGWTLTDKVGVLIPKPILTWAPQYFSVSSGPAPGPYRVVVAREKHRDDCSVAEFKLLVRDSMYVVHDAQSSKAAFSGPASQRVDRFTYTVTIIETESLAPGPAQLLAYITYKCPEGSVIVNYPDHSNLAFEITESK